MKVLILSCNTGGGHNTAAKALQEAFEKRGDDCTIKDALAFGGQLASDLVCDSYIEMVKKTPKLFGELYKMGNKVGKMNRENGGIHSPVYLVNKIYALALEKYINENLFDAVICVHIFPVLAMTSLKKHKKISCPFYFVSTDYYCPPMLEEADPVVFFTAHKDSLWTYKEHGIDSSRLVPAGIPVSQKFCTEKNREKARKELGFEKDDKVCILMSGSMGFGDTENIARWIFSASGEKLKLVAITGNNKKMYEAFQKDFEGEKRLVLVGWTDKVHLYLEAGDLLLTKPGGLSSTEAFVKGIPLVHTSPIPGCESENVEFFTEHHLSLCGKTSKDSARLAIKLLEDDFLGKQIMAAQKNYRYENSALTIADYVREHFFADGSKSVNQ